MDENKEMEEWCKQNFLRTTDMFKRVIGKKGKEQVTDPDLLFHNKTNRETNINNDDVTNLKIALDKINTVEDFLNMV